MGVIQGTEEEALAGLRERIAAIFDEKAERSQALADAMVEGRDERRKLLGSVDVYRRFAQEVRAVPLREPGR